MNGETVEVLEDTNYVNPRRPDLVVLNENQQICRVFGVSGRICPTDLLLSLYELK